MWYIKIVHSITILVPCPQVTCGSLGLSTATVKLIHANGDEHISCSVGTGPVDAAYKAVDLVVKVRNFKTFKLLYTVLPF